MPKIDDQTLSNEATKNVQPQQQAAQQTMQHLQDQVRDSIKQLLGELKGQPGVDQKALDQIGKELDQHLDRLQDQASGLDSRDMDRGLAAKVDEALGGRADAEQFSQKLDEQVKQAEDRLTKAEEKASQSANDPRTSDEDLHRDVKDCKAAEQELESFRAAQTAMEAARSLQQAEREVAEMRQELQQSMTPADAMAQLNRMVEEAKELAAEEDRKKRISMEMTNGEIEF